VLRILFTDGSKREIDADDFMCPEKITLFRKRNPKGEDGRPPETRFRVVEQIKTVRIRDIQEIRK